MNYEQAISLFRKEGYEPEPEVLRETTSLHDENTHSGKGTGYMSDVTFFRLLGITELYTMDVSDYEGCSIVHDLNQPIPESLYGQFDFIIDGGTFDHLFDLQAAFENVVKLLKESVEKQVKN